MYRRPLVMTVVLLALALVGSAAALGESPPAASTYTGTLTVIVGDPMPVAGEPMTPLPPIFTLNLADGRELRLLPGAAGENDLLRLAGQRVSVTLPAAEAESALAAADPAAAGVHVASVALAPGAVMVSPEVSGNTKWLSIACKFADIADEPKSLSYFQNMYANTYPGLDNYWREASYGAINLVGSTAVGWYTLPQPLSYYVIDDDTLKWNELFLDCAALADPVVNFADYMGINLMFNAEMGCCAWGGTRQATLDGVTKVWSVAWLPPWAYEDITVVSHEMTHAYGILWHSYAGPTPYRNSWDVVSNCWYGCGLMDDPTYGCLGQHTIAYHRAYLGWVPPARTLVLGSTATTFTLERLTNPPATGYLMAVIPIGGSTDHYYTLEFRQTVGYDVKLRDDSLVIHEIGGPNQLVQLIDPGDGQPWEPFLRQPGHTWVAPQDGLMVRVDAVTPTGYTVTVTPGLPVMTTTLTPTDDVYVSRATPDTNYGASPLLMTYSFYDGAETAKLTRLKFDQSQVPAYVARARLRLAVVQDDPRNPLPYVVYIVETYKDSTLPWTEGGLTYNNLDYTWSMPQIWYPIRNEGWMEWDVTSIVTWRGAGAFLIENGYERTFSSKEGANPPQLIIEYLVPPDEPTTTTFTPTNDATVSQAKPKLISGSKPTLQVKDAAKDLNAYVKFNVTGLDGAVRSATLRLWATNGGPDGGRVYATSPFYPGTTTQWLETGLKWSNAPAISGAPLDTAGAVTAGHWIELDVTAAITGNGRASFALTNDATDLIVYSSKEGAHTPELVIVTD